MFYCNCLERGLCDRRLPDQRLSKPQHIRLAMSGVKTDAQTRGSFGDGWRADSGDEKTLLLQTARPCHGCRSIARDNRDNVTAGRTDIQAGAAEAVTKRVSQLKHVAAALRLLLHQGHCAPGGGSERGGQGGR